jgi:hypothetical protein
MWNTWYKKFPVCLLAMEALPENAPADANLIQMLLESESAAVISLRELRQATKNFLESQQIGEGGHGSVYKLRQN